ncbi:MAG: GAF domain-containing protein [Ktedonobacteraceae bacterium]|nr:GAF domain-containing protein [Ktedonobacteraceae bacterium]
MQSQTPISESAYRSPEAHNGDRLAHILREMEYLNTIGKRFVAAIDRFQVHRALLAALQDLYSFSACSILLKGEPFELSIIPRYPLSVPFLQAMIQRIARAASIIDFPSVTPDELAVAAYLDAPDELALLDPSASVGGSEIGDFLNIPLTVENRIIGMLSLFDEREGTFDTALLQLTTMIADYAAVALENVRLRERETALWRDAELERRRLELVISSMAEGLLITNAHGAITSMNRSAQHLFAQTEVDLKLEQEQPLRALAAINQAEWLQEFAWIIDQALLGQTVTNQELIVGEGGETVPLTLSISAAPLHDKSVPQARPIGVVAVLNDITTNKQIEKLKDEFVSVVSHELRTPLTAIKGYAQHLVRRLERRLRDVRSTQHKSALPATEPPESYDLRSLHIVQSQAEHLERLVNDLLDLSRVQWGQLHLHYTLFHLADVLAAHVRSAQASAEQHSIQLDLQVQNSKIVADEARVGQVIGNILDNAVRYSPQGGQVLVRLQEQEGAYTVSVIDEGIGVSAEYLDHIFERFYRVRNAASRQYSGIGLGLYVARAIVEGHGGHIGFSSNQGLGSTFYFTLPREPRS